jgi:predicted butyrate kinase (DUF1464 family)
VPKNVTTVEVTDEEWIVAFNSPFAIKGYDYAAFCVEKGGKCIDAVEGNATYGTYAKKALNYANVTDLEPETAYTCYVATVFSKGIVCSEPVAIVTLSPPSPPSPPARR